MLKNRPRNSEDEAAEQEDGENHYANLGHSPAFNQVDAPSNIYTHLRANCEFLFPLLRRPQKGDGLFISIVRVMEEMTHEVLANGREQVAGLIKIVLVSGLRRHIGEFADIDKVFRMQFKLSEV